MMPGMLGAHDALILQRGEEAEAEALAQEPRAGWGGYPPGGRVRPDKGRRLGHGPGSVLDLPEQVREARVPGCISPLLWSSAPAARDPGHREAPRQRPEQHPAGRLRCEHEGKSPSILGFVACRVSVSYI